MTDTPAPRIRKRSTQDYGGRKRRSSGLGSFLMTIGVVAASAVGILAARVIPVTSLDWQGLFTGRNPQEVWLEGMGNKLAVPYQILVMGVDRVADAQPGTPGVFNGRSDTMMVLRFDPQGKITLLSIPRDTLVEIPAVGPSKINAANVYGGIPEAKAAVSGLLQGVRIDRYVRIDTTGLAAVIDALGGVEVNVPERMVYADKTQGLSIDLYPGTQVLNGKQAEGFSRFRADSAADIGRIQRQQLLIQAVQKKLASPWSVLRLRALLGVITQYLDTDLSPQEMIALASFSLAVPGEQIEKVTLPGEPSDPDTYISSYWLTQPEEVSSTIEGRFFTSTQEPAPFQ